MNDPSQINRRVFLKVAAVASGGWAGLSLPPAHADGPGASDRQRRYKLMWWSGTSEPAGGSMAFSPDGIRWTPYEDDPVLPFFPFDHPKAAIGVGDIVDLFHDPIRDRYGALLKLHAVEADGWKAGPRAGKAYRRLVGASVSEDAMHWKEPWRVMVPEPRDEGLLEFYSAGGTIARGPLLISFVRMLHDDYSPDTGRAPEGSDAPGAATWGWRLSRGHPILSSNRSIVRVTAVFADEVRGFGHVRGMPQRCLPVERDADPRRCRYRQARPLQLEITLEDIGQHDGRRKDHLLRPRVVACQVQVQRRRGADGAERIVGEDSD